MKKLFLMMFLVFGLSAQTLIVKDKWQLFGIIDNINDISLFNKDCIKILWKYDNNNESWMIYRPENYPEVKDYSKIIDLQAGDSIWVLGNSQCIVDSSSIQNPDSNVEVIKFPVPNEKRSIGVNISDNAYWSTEWGFLNLFKKSHGWLTQCRWNEDCGSSSWDTGEQDKIKVDENGWPIGFEDNRSFSYISTHLFTGVDGHFVDKEFVVLYEGNATVTYNNGCTKVSGENGRDEIKVTSEDGHGCTMQLQEIDFTNPIKNIAILPKGGICGDVTNYVKDESECESGFVSFEKNYKELIFHPKFLKDLENFSTLRFMDWMNTYHNRASTWEELMHENHYVWSPTNPLSSAGNVPVEIQVKLANRLKKDAWFNIPVRFPDAEVKKYAEYLKDNVDSSLKIYFEYGNEVWNTAYAFEQHQNSWVQEQANNDFKLHTSASGYTKRVNWYGDRVNKMCKAIKEVFEGQESRVVCVSSSQSSNPWTAQEQFNCPLAGGNCHTYVDALSIAPYVAGYLGNDSLTSNVENMSVEELFNELNNGGLYSNQWSAVKAQKEFDDLKYQLSENKKIANKYSMRLVSYEAGQHLVGTGTAQNNIKIENLFSSANRSVLMGEYYKKYLDTLFEYGLENVMHYSNVRGSSKYGNFGLKEYQDQNSTVKFDTVNEYIKTLKTQ